MSIGKDNRQQFESFFSESGNVLHCFSSAARRCEVDGLYGCLHRDAFTQRIQRGIPIFHQDQGGGVENLFANLYSLRSRHASLGPRQGDGLNLASGRAVLQFLINGVATLASGLNAPPAGPEHSRVLGHHQFCSYEDRTRPFERDAHLLLISTLDRRVIISHVVTTGAGYTCSPTGSRCRSRAEGLHLQPASKMGVGSTGSPPNKLEVTPAECALT
jgi:hypothetical protein